MRLFSGYKHQGVPAWLLVLLALKKPHDIDIAKIIILLVVEDHPEWKKKKKKIPPVSIFSKISTGRYNQTQKLFFFEECHHNLLKSFVSENQFCPNFPGGLGLFSEVFKSISRQSWNLRQFFLRSGFRTWVFK